MRSSTPYSFFIRYWNTSNCSVPTTPTMTSSMPASGDLEDLDGALLGDLLGALDELLALHGVLGADPAEVLRGKGGDAGRI